MTIRLNYISKLNSYAVVVCVRLVPTFVLELEKNLEHYLVGTNVQHIRYQFKSSARTSEFFLHVPTLKHTC